LDKTLGFIRFLKPEGKKQFNQVKKKRVWNQKQISLSFVGLKMLGEGVQKVRIFIFCAGLDPMGECNVI
jgi:hypothetical protein